MPDVTLATNTLPQVGALFAGKYQIDSILGEGGMGIVYRGIHKRLGQRVAIKVLLPDLRAHAEIVARFEREALAAAQLRSRYTARVTDVGEDERGLPYMVMEYLEGQDIALALETRGRFPITEAVDYILQACSAMAEAHKLGIVHRDLKPSNLFLADEDGTVVVKVLDFGISKFEDSRLVSVTSTKATMGTPLYMSPEQVRSARDVDLRSDIWSLGIMLYQFIAGRAPFEGLATTVGAAIVTDDPPSLVELAPEVPRELEAVILRALAKKRDARYPDAESFAAALAPWGSRSPISRVGPEAHGFQPSGVTAIHLPRTRASMHAPTMIAAAASTAAGHEVRAAPRTGSRRSLVVAAAGALLLGAGGFFAFARTTARPIDVAPASASSAISAISSDAQRIAPITAERTQSVPVPPLPLASASASAAIVPSQTPKLTRPPPPVVDKPHPFAPPAHSTALPPANTPPSSNPTRL